MQNRVEPFLNLSAELTGFTRLELLGTGMTAEYLRTLHDALPGGVFDALIEAYTALPAAEQREQALATGILGDAKLGPVARSLMLLWYCGAWSALSDAWHAAYGPAPRDTNHVVSAAAYQAGLQWVAAYAHAAGSHQAGFGSWSLAPGQWVVA